MVGITLQSGPFRRINYVKHRADPVFLRKVGAAPDAACVDILANGFLHPMIQGILQAEASGLTPSEFASVLGTSEKTGAKGEQIGNSWLVNDLTTAFCDQWSGDTISVRDSRSRRTEQISATVETYSLPSWEPIDEEYYEDQEEVDFAEGVFGASEEWREPGSSGETELEGETADSEAYLIEQFGSMEDAGNYVDEAYASVSRTFDEVRKVGHEVKKARGYFPIVGIGCYDDGFASWKPSTTSFPRTWRVTRTQRRNAPQVQCCWKRNPGCHTSSTTRCAYAEAASS